MPGSTLLVFAHADEAEAFAAAGVPHLITGVGKINATLALTEALLGVRGQSGGSGVGGAAAAGVGGGDGAAVGAVAGASFERVVVLGTAGAVDDEVRLDTVYQIEAFVQHDFSLPSPKVVPAGPLLEGVPLSIIATGDVFVQDDSQRAALSAVGAQLVDMESYAYAVVCERLGIPLQVFKAPSDFANSSTTQDEWDGVVMTKSRQLFEFARARLPELFG